MDVEELIQSLVQVKTEAATQTEYNNWPINLLTDYIEKKHHRYVEAKTPELKTYLHKIVKSMVRNILS